MGMIDSIFVNKINTSDLANAPIVVDLDGTLTPVDTLVEIIIQLIKQSVLNIFKIPYWAIGGLANLKCEIAARANISVEFLPYRIPVLEFLKKEHENGRKIILATAAHRSIAEDVSQHLGIFDFVIATDEITNMKGANKLEAILRITGPKFIYVGDSSADIPIWSKSTAAIMVCASKAVSKLISQKVEISHEFPLEKIGWISWIKAMRAYQWSKNLLIFVPFLTAFAPINATNLSLLVIAFFSFSFAASAAYIVNDILDLEADRVHPSKCFRPFASGKITAVKGLLISMFLFAVALVLSSYISKLFMIVIVVYICLTFLYSLVFKRYALLDIIILSILYTIRIIAGCITLNVSATFWLLSFSIFIFLSLALVKRCSELKILENYGISGYIRGRSYCKEDLGFLSIFGVGSALSAVLILGIFINDPSTQDRYAFPELLWLVVFGILYWLISIWMKTLRGEMVSDPLVFALTNRGSLLTIAIVVALFFASHYLLL